MSFQAKIKIQGEGFTDTTIVETQGESKEKAAANLRDDIPGVKIIAIWPKK